MWLIFLFAMLIVVAAVVYISYKNSVDKLKRDNPGVTVFKRESLQCLVPVRMKASSWLEIY